MHNEKQDYHAFIWVPNNLILALWNDNSTKSFINLEGVLACHIWP